VNINFGLFAKPMKNMTSLDDFDFIVLIFKSIDKQLGFNLNKTNCNKFLNQRRNLPTDVISTAKTADLSLVSAYFQTHLIPLMDSLRINKLIANLRTIISKDAGIESADKQRFESLASISTLPEFLASIFLYVIPLSNDVPQTVVFDNTDSSSNGSAPQPPSAPQYQQNNFNQTINVNGSGNIVNGFVLNQFVKKGGTHD